MDLFISIAGAVLPSILILKYFLKKDLHPEPSAVIAGTFFKGILSVFPVLLIGIPLDYINPFKGTVLHAAVYTAFVVAAIPEEYFKFRVLNRYSMKNRSFDEPMDGIVYGVTASLGFATLENVMYVLQGGFYTAVIRAITSVPAHASWGAIMGYYAGQAVFDPKRRTSVHFGLITAMILHGLYDLPLMYLANKDAFEGPHEMTESERYAVLLFIGVLVVSIALAVGSARKLNIRQKENRSQIVE